MSEPATTTTEEGSLLWTLEEISHLVSRGGNAAETLTNIVQLIQRRFATDVCSVYLLEADRSTLVLAATIGLRPESVGRVRMRLTEGLAGLVGQQLRPLVVEDATRHPRFKYFGEAGEDPYHSFLGVPVIDRGLLQGVLIVQTREPRAFAQDVVSMLMTAGAQLAPIVAEARTLRQFVAPAHQRLSALARNLWWSWDETTISLFRDIDPVLWREVGHNPVALLQQIPVDTLEERASQLVLHSRINHAYRRMQEYLSSAHTWGARHAGVLWARPVAYFSAEFGFHESIPIYSGGLGILAGDHVKASSDLGIPLVGDRALLRSGLLPSAARSRRPAARRLHRRRQPATSDRAGDRDRGRRADHDCDRDAHGTHQRPRLEAHRRPQHGLSDRLRRRRQSARRSRSDGAALRRRRTRPHPPGAAARHRRRARADRARHFTRRDSSQRRPQRVRRAGAGAAADDHRRHRRGRSDPPRRRAGRVHHAHAGAGGPRSLLARSRRRASRAAARVARPRRASLPRARTRAAVERSRDVLHDRARAEAVAARERGVVAARPGVARDVVAALRGPRGQWTRLGPGSGDERVPIGHITNGVHVRSWLAPQMHQVYDRHLGPDWPVRCADAGCWEDVDRDRRWRAVGDASDAEDAADRVRAAARGARGGTARRARGQRSRS